MVELFATIHNEKSKSIKIKCDHITYWRSDKATDLVNYIADNIDDFIVERFDVKPGRVFEEEYIQAFNIELHMTDKVYDNIMKKFRHTIARYNKELDITLYEHKWE